MKFVPENELGVLYLFARNHRKLGFERIVKITGGFPDIIAIRNRKLVKIELEYKISRFLRHYKTCYFDAKDYELDEDEHDWIFRRRPRRSKNLRPVIRFPKSKYKVQGEKFETIKGARPIIMTGAIIKPAMVVRWKVRRYTLKDKVDVIVCWEKDIDIKDEIEVIELSKLKDVLKIRYFP